MTGVKVAVTSVATVVALEVRGGSFFLGPDLGQQRGGRAGRLVGTSWVLLVTCRGSWWLRQEG